MARVVSFGELACRSVTTPGTVVVSRKSDGDSKQFNKHHRGMKNGEGKCSS